MTISTSQSSNNEVVTFDTANPFTDRPIVVAIYGGDRTTNTGYGGGSNVIEGAVITKVTDITTLNFRVYIHKPNATNWGANGFIWYQWIAIGA